MSGNALSVLQVSPQDVGGGAEKVALDLHRAYLARGVDAWLAVGRKFGDDPRVVAIPNEERSSAWTRGLTHAADSLARGRKSLPPLARVVDRSLRTAANPAHMARVQRGREDFDFPGTSYLLELLPSRPDVLHLHNLHGGYFDIRALPRLGTRVPTILTMHDVWAITGHCAYPMECQRWRTGCGECPDLSLPIPIRRDASVENRRIKREALREGRVRLATPSRWLMGLARDAGLVGDLPDARVIPNGVDPAVFHPGSRADARQRLGLPEDALVVVFAAVSAKSSPFKGYVTLEAALPLVARGLSARDTLMLAVGQDAPETHVGDIPVRFVPFIQDPRVMADYYRAADLYLHPARAENFPLAILEAMACGTPVVASDAGGIPEMVVHGETGLLFGNGDAAALATATLEVLADPDLRERFSAAGITRVLTEFTLERQVGRYLEWYRELVERVDPAGGTHG